MNQENIINFSSYKSQKQNHPFQDEKLFCFYDVFKDMGIDLKEIQFQSYTRPDYQIRSIIFALTSDEEIDLKQNFIFNFLDNIKFYYKLYCNEELNLTRSLRADYIFSNIAAKLFDCEFSNRSLDNKKQKDIIDSIRWLNQNNFIFKKIFIIYCAYLNTDLKTCKKIANLAIDDPIKFDEFGYNTKLLSKSFIDSLSKEEYHQIINIIISNSYIYPKLEDTFYQYAKTIFEINPNFFSSGSSFNLFFKENSQTIIDVFGIDRITKMSEEELNYISNKDNQKDKLIEIKQLIDLGISIPKIDKILCYPEIIRLGYHKVVLIRKLIRDKDNTKPEKVLSKKR